MKETIVIKIGGIASQQLPPDFVQDIKEWQAAGKQVVIVHGGGFAINKMMQEEGIEVEKIDGLRVTSKRAMQLVEKALFDLGEKLTATLLKADCDVIQLQSNLENLFEADFLNQDKYGYVGQINQVHEPVLEKFFKAGLIPVIASMAAKGGEWLNVNADYVATALAIAVKADQLILMTDVPGVKENGQVLAQLPLHQIDQKINSGIITGGMVPKIKGASQTVEAGVQTVLISDNLKTGTLICQA